MLRHLSTRLATGRNVGRLTTRTMSSSAAPPPSPQFAAAAEAQQPSILNERFAEHRLHNPSDGFYWRSSFGEVTVPDMTLDEYVWKNVAKWPNKIALVCGITGRKYTYARLRDHCAAVAWRLRAQYRLQRGDVVAISMPNVPEFAIVALGALEAGLTLTTINPAYTAAEHAKQLEQTAPKLVFGLVENVATLQEAARLAKLSATDVPLVAVRTHVRQSMPEGVRDFAELMDLHDADFAQLGAPVHRPDDICVLPFSSGTTGLPKGVMLTHNNIAVNCEMLDMPLPQQRMMLPTTNDFQDVLPCVLPFFHIYGFTFLLMSKLALGCKVVTLPRFEPETFVTAMAEHKATFLALVPPLLLFLANDDRVQSRHLYNVRQIMCGAASSGQSDADRLRDRKARSVKFMQGYGMTETSPVSLLSMLPNVNYDSIGRPVASTEVKIARTDDASAIGLDVHEEGELLVRGPQVMRGYLNNPEATAEVMAPGGWLRTGDIGAYDQDGAFYVRDRVKELIKVSGYQVPPAELEEVLRSHSAVLDAGVIGVPHERYGEVPRAYVQVKSLPDGVDGRAVVQELTDYVSERVAKFKRLRGGVVVVDSIPRSATGKILRRELKRLYL